MPTFVLAILDAIFGGGATVSNIDTALQLGPRP
jgi:hypothetical protein